MSNPASWLVETFSSKVTENDLIKARALNSTRISAVVLPVLTGIWTAIAELADKPPFNDTGFQRVLIIALLAFLAVVLAADILGRSWVSTKQQPAVATLANRLPVKRTEGVDAAGHAVAFRATPGKLEFLFVPTEGAPAWIPSDDLHFTAEARDQAEPSVPNATTSLNSGEAD